MEYTCKMKPINMLRIIIWQLYLRTNVLGAHAPAAEDSIFPRYMEYEAHRFAYGIAGVGPVWS